MSADTEYLFDLSKESWCTHMSGSSIHIPGDGVFKASELLPRIGRLVHMEGTLCSAGGAGLVSAGTTNQTPLDEIVRDILPHPLSLMQAFLPNGLSE